MWFLMNARWGMFNFNHMTYVLALFHHCIQERFRWPEVEAINMCDITRLAVGCDNANVVTDLMVGSPFTLLLPGRRGHIIEAKAFKSFQVQERGRIHQPHEEKTGCKWRKAE